MADLTGAAAQRQNLGSWTGLPKGLEAQQNLFTTPVSGARLAFVEAALRTRPHIQFEGTKFFSLVDYDKAPQYPEGDFQGHYLVVFSDGTKVVLQVKPRMDWQTYNTSDLVYEKLSERGVLGPKLVGYSTSEGPVTGFRGYGIAVASYREGRHLDPRQKADMVALGAGLAGLQAAMQEVFLGLNQRIAENAQSTRALIRTGYEYVQLPEGQAYLKDVQGYTEEQVQSLVRAAEIFESKDGNPVMCHGDLVPGNVILTEDGRVAFLDFDNVSSSVFPEGIDIGLATFRIGWDQLEEVSAEGDLALLDAVLEGCNGEVGSLQRMSREGLLDAMEMAASYKAFSVMGQVKLDVNAAMKPSDKVKRHAGMYFRFAERKQAVLKVLESAPSAGFKADGDVGHLNLDM